MDMTTTSFGNYCEMDQQFLMERIGQLVVTTT